MLEGRRPATSSGRFGQRPRLNQKTALFQERAPCCKRQSRRVTEGQTLRRIRTATNTTSKSKLSAFKPATGHNKQSSQLSIMNIEVFKKAIREALLQVKKPRKCEKLLESRIATNNPFWGHCAQATEAGYVLGQILYGADFRFKAFKNKISGHESHYWLANPMQGQEQDVCDLTDHVSDLPFDYSNRKLSGWINAKRLRNDIKKANVRKIYDLAFQKLTKG